MKNLILLILFSFLSVCGYSQHLPVDKIITTLLDKNSKEVFIIAHRGDWRNYPENSIEAINGAIELGVEVVEIDIQKTKDGHLILMHDKTIDRTTSGKGLVSNYTLDSLQKLTLRDGLGTITRMKIPTLEEAMLAAKGKVMVNLDKCYDYFADAFVILKKTGTTRQVIMKAEAPVQQVKAEFGKYLNQVIFMPIVNLNKSEAETIINDYLSQLKPVAMELIFKTEDPEVSRLLNIITRSGTRVWINSLWASLNAGHDDELSIKDIPNSYGWITEKYRATMIQTDRPVALRNYLQKNGIHR